MVLTRCDPDGVAEVANRLRVQVEQRVAEQAGQVFKALRETLGKQLLTDLAETTQHRQPQPRTQAQTHRGRNPERHVDGPV
ncbi:hypothetical protein [Deinococcus sp. QL22]|uniref:hypothetical protein n=1 Tax=Deinococcus sp. QL22 TaxID=2939437 RepID=UPI002016EF39|nr:hypothetical protein [Deinococcus sp. QL22]UQN10262.1 hypothetical protein M1R55_28210 [Deinococcus sp. QL22]